MKLTAFLAALLLGTTAMAQTAAAPAAPAWTFALHGFVSMSGGYQTGSFTPSEGQQSLTSTTGVTASGGTLPDKGSFTADVRQSRFNFSVKGPQVLMGATPSGVLEIDFFNGFGAGNYGDVSLFNRMRLAYAELNWGPQAKLQFGQQNDLVFAMAPTSLSHIAFPLGYFTGNIGWRRPGVFGYHTFTVAPDVKVEGAWEVGRSQWADQPAAAGNATIGNTAAGSNCAGTGGITCGEASGGPALEGRVSLAYAKYLTAFVSAHYQNIDANGYGAAGVLGTSTKSTIQTTAYNGGLKLILPIQGDMGVTIAGTGFTGKNVAPLIANMTTANNAFKYGPNGEDVSTTGWWAQVGFNLTKEFSLWGFYGDQSINKTDFATAAMGTGAAYENTTTNVMAMYRDGGFGFSVEWIDFKAKIATAGGTSAAAPITAHRTATSDQYLFSANYFF